MSHRNREVDFVLEKPQATAIEVTSGRRKDALPGIDAFLLRVPKARPLLVGAQGVPLEEFFASPLARLTRPGGLYDRVLVQALAFQAVLVPYSPLAPEPEEPVMRTIALREDQTLEQLHEALRLAFGWADAHLYAFWLDGTWWSQDRDAGYWAPFELEQGQRSARVPVGELGIRKGKKIAYVFDFGDEWRLLLRLVDRWPAGEHSYPMLVEAEGTPSPQYPALEEDE